MNHQRLLRTFCLVCLFCLICLPATGFADPQPVNDLVSTSFTGYRFNRSSFTFDSVGTITNISPDTTLNAPMLLAVKNISAPTVTLANAVGTTTDGFPFVDVPLPGDTLAPGASVTDIVLQFANPTFVFFTFDTGVRSELPSAGNAPPVLDPIGNQSVPLGSALALTLTGTDPDNDPLTFSATPLPLPANASLNAMTGDFTFQPGANQVGVIPITFIISDGLLTDSETVEITVEDAAPGGETALTGRILDTNDFTQGTDTPVVGATVSILGGVSTVSDAGGNFTLSGIPSAESYVFDIDPSTAIAAPDGSPYAGFREDIALIEGVTNVVDRPFFLPRIATESLTTVDPNTTTIVENPTLGVILEIPPFSARNPDGSFFTGQLSISEVPDGLAPAALPEEFQPGMLITIQPVGVTFNPPALITFPNIDNMAPGSEVDIWSLDPDTGTFVVVGIGVVSADGSVIETISGGIRAADWHFVAPLVNLIANLINNNNHDCCLQTQVSGNSATAVASGDLSEEHDLTGYRSLGVSRTPRLVYHSLQADPRPIIASNVTVVGRSSLPRTISSKLMVAGIDQGVEIFTQTGGVLNSAVDETIRQVMQFDGSGFQTGLYSYSASFTNHFARSARSSTQSGKVLVNNQQGSPFGAGWQLTGLSRLHFQPNNDVLLVEGSGSARVFTPAARSTGEFSIAGSFDVGELPRSVIVDDFDKDGNLDFAVTNNGDSTISILFGDGTGNFPRSNTVGTGASPVSMTGADFNNDGNLDLATANQVGNNDVSVLLGDGTGNFLTPSHFNVVNMLSVAVDSGDVNNDGNPDLAAPNFNGNRTLVLFGDGAGDFPNRTLPGTGNGPNTVGIADLNGDGNADIITGNQFSNSINVRLGDGAGSFPTSINFGVNPRPRATTELPTADLNNDGDIDLAFVWTNVISILFGDGTGSFSSRIDFPSPGSLTSVAIGDVDGDDRLDVIATEFPSTVVILFGDGLGNFSVSRISNVGNTPRSAGLADFNGDGALDLAVADAIEDKVFILLGTPDPLRGFRGPPGDFTTLEENADGSFTRTLKNGTQIHFDTDGLQTSVIDRNGNETTYAYDALGRLTEIIDPAGLATMLTYSGDHLANVTDPAGRTTQFEHDTDGNLTRITDPDGSFREFAYDGRHHMTSQTSKQGFVTTYEYDAVGRHIKSNLPDGSTREIAPGQTVGLVDGTNVGTEGNPAPATRPGDVIATFTDGNGNVTTYRTDRFGAATETTDALNRTTTMTRNEDGNPTEIVAPNGTVTMLTYDDRGNVLEVIEASGETEERQTDFVYEPDFNQLTKITDPAGNVTNFEYDANGNLTRVVDPLNGERLMTYNSQGLLLTRTDKNGNTTSFTYDANSNLSTVTDAEGNITQFTRDTAGNITAMTEGVGSPEERTSFFTYDNLNRLLTATDGTNATTQFRYDDAGNLVEVEIPTGQIIRRSYDERNRVTQIEDPITGTTQFSYDPNGNLTASADALNNPTTFAYDPVNRLIQSIDALNGEQQFTYDVQDNIIAVQDALNQITSFEYDTLDRQIKRINSLNQETTFAYDERDNLTATTDPKGQAITNTYDELSRLTETATPDNTISLSYDPASNLLTVADSDSNLSFTYDGLNRVATEGTVDVGVQPAVTQTSTYDAIGNRTRLDDSKGGTIQYTYDAADRLTQLVTPATDTINLAYDLAGRLEQIAFPNTVVSDYQYDALGRLDRLDHIVGGVLPLASFDYAYNAVGNVTFINELTQTRNFAYDELQRLISGGTGALPESYTYDAEGNRVTSHISASHTHNDANRLLEDNDFTYSYDANGNLETQTDNSTSDVTTYTYDAQDQLTRIDFPDGTTTSYRYDGLGRRIEKNVDGTISRYVYDGEDIALEFDSSNTLITRYSHGDQTDQPLSLERGGQRFFYHADHQGSIRKITDSFGSEVNSYDYDAYGRLESIVEGIQNSYAYTGRELDSESGLYYYRSRYYDSQTGRFTSEDPIGFGGGDANLYRYVFNNPVNFVDSRGDQVVLPAPPIILVGVVLITGQIIAEILKRPPIIFPSEPPDLPEEDKKQLEKIKETLGKAVCPPPPDPEDPQDDKKDSKNEDGGSIDEGKIIEDEQNRNPLRKGGGREL